jgi:hypothetical protein
MLKSELVELNVKVNLPFWIKNSYQFNKDKQILENSKLRLQEIQGYFVANCVPICQNKWDTHFDADSEKNKRTYNQTPTLFKVHFNTQLLT